MDFAAKDYSRLNSYKARESKTLMVVGEMISDYPNYYVASSFGKDSSVLLDLVLRNDPCANVRFVSHPETNLLGNYEEVISLWKARYPGMRLTEIHLSRDSALETKANTQRNALESCDANAFFVGLRAEESKGRRITLRKDGIIHLQKRTGFTRLCPLAWWKTIDVAAYVTSHDLPTLAKYTKEGFDARTTSGLPHNQFALETIAYLRTNDPMAFNKLSSIYPDLQNLIANV